MTFATSTGAMRRRLARPIDGASLAMLRVAFGLIMVWEVIEYVRHDWIARFWIEPAFHFTYYAFGWVHPWPGAGMYVHFGLMGAAALLVALGLWYRVAAALFWLAFTYMFLLEQARYLHHFYAASLVAFLLAVVPANATFSIDAWRRRGTTSAPTVPTWALWIIRAQVAAVYVFGGIAKFNGDWVRGEPMRSWLLASTDIPLIDLIVRNELELAMFSYGGLLFDLLVVPSLLWRRTRPFAFAAAIAFHFLNSQLFNIGIFPVMALATTTLFFEPDWPRALVRWFAGAERESEPSPSRAPVAAATSVGPLGLSLLGLYMLIQVTVPLRHLLYPGPVSWTEEGHRFSWRMMLRLKNATARFYVTSSRTHETKVVRPETYLTDWQITSMTGRPDMILQFAHFLAREHGAPGAPAIVRADVMVSLNKREPRRLIDQGVDLASQPRTLGAAAWITPAPAAGRRVAASAGDAARIRAP